MTQKTNRFERFWKELKRRKVIHVITVYAAIAFVILQVTNMVVRPLRLPDWTEAFVIFLLCIGFVISVFVSWVYDITPAGVRKTKPIITVKYIDQTIHVTSSRWKIATYISGVIIFALIAFNFISRRNLNEDILKLEKSIAVLPFLNESPVDSNKYFINGIMEEILTNLQKIKDFRVVSRTSADQYKGQDRPAIPEIAKKLNVNYVVEGSGQKYGKNFVLRVQLITGKKERHLWANSYEQEIREVKDYIKIQSQIAQAIAAELKAVITPDEKHRIEKIPTENIEAYDLYLKGTYCYQKSTAEGFKKASEYYEQALQKDPNYALAYLGLANVNGGSTFFGNVPPHEAFPKVIEYVNKALKIDSTLAEAYMLLGNIDTYINWNWKAAELNYKRALQINPNLPLIHASYSGLLSITGRFEEAIYEAKRAQELDPLSGFFNTGFTFYMAGQYDRAIEELKMNLTKNPEYYQTHMFLGLAYLEKEMNKEAVSEFEKAVDLSDGNPSVIAWLVVGYYFNGENDRADELFDSLKERSETEYVPATFFYLIYLVRGEEDLAFEWLKRACKEHDTYLPVMRSLIIQAGSRYQALLKEVGLI